MQIVPFHDEHMDPAAALLAAGAAAEREREPALPAWLAEPKGARGAIGRALAAPRAEGLAALHEGRLAAFLIGAIELPNPLSHRSLMDPPRAGWITCHAAHPPHAEASYRALYAVLAERWVAAGSFAHHIGVRDGVPSSGVIDCRCEVWSQAAASSFGVASADVGGSPRSRMDVSLK